MISILPSLYLLCSLLFQASETSLDHIILTSSPNSECNIDSHSIMPTGERPCRLLTVQLYNCISSQSQYPARAFWLFLPFTHLLQRLSHYSIPWTTTILLHPV